VDVLGEVDGHYETLYSLSLYEGTFSNKEKLERFLAYLKRATALGRFVF
jgi:hypothetical protein